VYAGAIMVLFLFVIMLLGTEVLPDSKALPWQKPLAGVLAGLLAVESIYLLLARARSTASIVSPEVVVNSTESLRSMGMELFSKYLLPFEATSILLLVAMVGAIVLTKKEKGAQK
jgi:NADH-quinone oxidoreductase subunit J